jgi:hypothetical protein
MFPRVACPSLMAGNVSDWRQSMSGFSGVAYPGLRLVEGFVTPSNIFLFNVFHLQNLIPPHGFLSLELIDGNYSFCMRRIIMQLKILPRSQQPYLCIFILLVLTIKCRRFDFIHLSSYLIHPIPIMLPDKGWT